MISIRLIAFFLITPLLFANYSAEGLTIEDYSVIARNQGFEGSSVPIRAKQLFAQGNLRNNKDYNFVAANYPSFELGTSAEGLTLGEYMILARSKGAEGPYIRSRAKVLFLEANYKERKAPYFRNIPLNFSLDENSNE